MSKRGSSRKGKRPQWSDDVHADRGVDGVKPAHLMQQLERKNLIIRKLEKQLKAAQTSLEADRRSHARTTEALERELAAAQRAGPADPMRSRSIRARDRVAAAGRSTTPLLPEASGALPREPKRPNSSSARTTMTPSPRDRPTVPGSAPPGATRGASRSPGFPESEDAAPSSNALGVMGPLLWALRQRTSMILEPARGKGTDSLAVEQALKQARLRTKGTDGAIAASKGASSGVTELTDRLTLIMDVESRVRDAIARGCDVAAEHTLAGAIKRTVQGARALVGADKVHVYLVTESGQYLVDVTWTAGDARALPSEALLPAFNMARLADDRRSAAAMVASKAANNTLLVRQGVVVVDSATDSKYGGDTGPVSVRGGGVDASAWRSTLAVPVSSGTVPMSGSANPSTLAVIECISKKPSAFSAADRNILAAFSDIVGATLHSIAGAANAAEARNGAGAERAQSPTRRKPQSARPSPYSVKSQMAKPQSRAGGRAKLKREKSTRRKRVRRDSQESEVNVAATKVQSLARGRRARQQVAARKAEIEAAEEVAATKIQSAARGRQARRRVRGVRRNKAATKIQSVSRGRQARRRVKEMSESAEVVEERTRRAHAASKIQARWRGTMQRKQVAQMREIVARKMEYLAASHKLLKRLKQEDIDQLRALKSPSESIVIIAAALCVLLGEKPSWRRAKKRMEAPDFIETLVKLDRKDLTPERRNIVITLARDKSLHAEARSGSLPASQTLARWIMACVSAWK